MHADATCVPRTCPFQPKAWRLVRHVRHHRARTKNLRSDLLGRQTSQLCRIFWSGYAPTFSVTYTLPTTEIQVQKDMADTVSKQVRSRMMSAIRSGNTKPEMTLRKMLHARGFRYRLHDGKLPGKPDLVFPKYKVVLFVHGCFWHRHKGCKYATTPSTNEEFWAKKFEKNVERDIRATNAFLSEGWRVGIVWECLFKSGDNERAIDDILEFIDGRDVQYAEWPLVAEFRRGAVEMNDWQ